MIEKRAVALGFFDGVHIGHGRLLQACRAAADKIGCSAAALTFDRHPDTLVQGTPVQLINTPQDRAGLMRRLYFMDEVLTLHFDEAMMRMPWSDFLEQILLRQYNAVYLVCGHNFRFGCRGEGTPELLQAWCTSHGIGCQVIPAVTLEGIPVSSTYIRGLLRTGDTAVAARFLGHPHVLTGAVVSGRQIGRTMDIPTANLIPPADLLIPARGVYASRVWTNGQVYLAATNVGYRPTVNGEALTVEPWLLDFSGNLYGQEIRVEFWRYLRGERKFSNLQELKTEILRNARQTRSYFQDQGISSG